MHKTLMPEGEGPPGEEGRQDITAEDSLGGYANRFNTADQLSYHLNVSSAVTRRTVFSPSRDTIPARLCATHNL